MSRPLAAAATAAVCVAVVVAALAGMPFAASAAPRTDGGDFRLVDGRITESSGLALSRRHPHVVWTANDSGDGARVFAVDTRTGRTVGVHRFAADVVDVEALAMAPDGRLLVGDVGDNGATRSVVRVYSFAEPALGDTSGAAVAWPLAYPDGPHDAESLAVSPVTGRVYLVTKAQAGAVFALPAHPSSSAVNRLTEVAAAPSVATDAVFLADGSALAVRTYTSLVLLDGRSFQRTARSLLPPQPQGETLALAPGGAGLLAGSEGMRSLVQRISLPTPPATPSVTPTVTPTSTTTAGTAPTATRPTPGSARPTPATPAPVAAAEPAARAAPGKSWATGGTATLVIGVVVGTLLVCLAVWGLGRVTRRR